MPHLASLGRVVSKDNDGVDMLVVFYYLYSHAQDRDVH